MIGAAADELVADRPGLVEIVALAEQREVEAAGARRRAPASGSSTPAISRRSVDFPSPLRPTTPTRSPADTPSVRSRSTERLP